MPIAYAHNLYDALPPETFIFKLAWDPALLLFVGFAVYYYLGLKAYKGHAPVKKWQIACYYVGVAIVIAALLPPIDPLSDQLFFVHMIQHIMITNIGVPLMMFGVPFVICSRGLTPGVRKYLFLPVVKSSILRRLLHFFSQPLVALFLFQFAYWFWHVPYYYNLALLNDGWHLLEHACFAVASLLFWRNIIDPYPMRSPLRVPVRLLYIAALMASNIILSAFLTFSDDVWYAYEGRPLPEWWQPWNHLDDQRLGGLIMWVPGEFIDFIVMTGLFFTWVHREERRKSEQVKLATQ